MAPTSSLFLSFPEAARVEKVPSFASLIFTGFPLHRLVHGQQMEPFPMQQAQEKAQGFSAALRKVSSQDIVNTHSLQIQVGQAPLITGKVCMFFDEFYLRKPLRDFNPFDLGMAFSTELLPYLCSLYHTG